jgi:hypothetical protein
MLIGHDLPETTDVSGVRSIIHLVLSWLSFIWVSVESEEAFDQVKGYDLFSTRLADSVDPKVTTMHALVLFCM